MSELQTKAFRLADTPFDTAHAARANCSTTASAATPASKAGCATTTTAAPCTACATRPTRHWPKPRANASSPRRCAKFAILDARCVHRIGDLAIGELAVWVGVSAAHRDAAFAACRYVIDEVKARVPIWKHERYADGDAGWLHPDRPETP